MKNLRTLWMLAVLLFSVLINAQETEARQAVNDLYAALGTLPSADDTVYVFIDDGPDARKYLPAPPDTSSMEFMDDLLQFQWGKAQRNTPRGAQASRESLWTVEMMRVLMAEALSIDTISDTETPALARLLAKSFYTGKQSTHSAKANGWRTRPFVQMNDAIWAQYDDDNLRNNSSYPSGHSALGWYTALSFAEMWPELQDTILRRGFQFGENRVIAGAHYQSDVIAGYLCAAAAFARSHINPELQKDIAAARAEYAKMKGLPEDYDPVTPADVPHGESILNNPVDTASYRYISDMMKHWAAKPLRNTERGKQAAREADYSVAMILEVYSDALGIELTETGAPAITALLTATLEKCSETADRLKVIRFRKRPFVQLGEPSFVPGDEEKERGKSSFPSGHTNLGWTTALVMSQVIPEHPEEILYRGYQYGYNRLIVGYHWASDIEATRLLSTGLFARLNADPAFQVLVANARAEYLKITGQDTSVGAPAAVAPSVTRAYRLDGTPATSRTHGIVIQNGQKIIRRE